MFTERELALQRLSTRQIAELKERGTVRAVRVGDLLFGERSFERGEDWGWCFVDEVFVEPAPSALGT